MRVTSRIKSIFNDELLRYTAAICDTRRIESNADKMVMLGNLLYTYGIKFEILGGATNRIALQIDGYAVKFAMDEQGYLDNKIEYSLSPELQPYVTKSFETNGYILIAECVEAITTEEKFRAYRYDILKVLEALSQDYLLGDVGAITKNMTNWGLRDGKPVILDYAYCHRATENLFTCSRCGGVLMYDSTYDKLMCTDRSACKAIYTYNERKRIQGTAVDEKMVAEREADSIVMRQGVKSKEIELFEDKLLSDNYFVIDNPGDLHRYEKLKEEILMNLAINGEEGDVTMMDRFSAIVKLAQNPNDADAQQVVFQNLGEEAHVPEPMYTENYQNTYAFGYVPPMRVYRTVPQEVLPGEPVDSDAASDDDDVYDYGAALSDMISKVKAERAAAEMSEKELRRKQDDIYLAGKKKQMEEEKESANEEERESDGGGEIDADAKETASEGTEEAESSTEAETHERTEAVHEDDSESAQSVVEESEESAVTVYSTEGADNNAEEESTGITVNGKPLKVGEEMTIHAGK